MTRLAKKRLFFPVFGIIAALFISGCATSATIAPGRSFKAAAGRVDYGGYWGKEGYKPYTPASDVSPDVDFAPVWEKIFDGIYLAKSFKTNPPLAVFCVRVDLSSQRISVIISGGVKDPVRSYYPGKRTSTFLKENKCVVAMNGECFSPYTAKEGTHLNLIAGPAMANGVSYANGCTGTGMLVAISSDKKFTFDMGYGGMYDVVYAFSGWPFLNTRRDYPAEKTSDVFGQRNPRSAIGISGSGRYLYLLVVDGRRDGWSVGVDCNSLADWMRMHGASTAINMDGGGSSTLVIADRDGNPVILNKVSDPTERVVANHIGILLSGS
jgi:hypothetical protein